MRPKEHQLMIQMFIIQGLLIKTLADILRSNDLISDADIEPFNNFNHTLPVVEPVSERTVRTYLEVAQKLGLEIPVKGLP
jgi:hypothetical protein